MLLYGSVMVVRRRQKLVGNKLELNDDSLTQMQNAKDLTNVILDSISNYCLQICWEERYTHRYHSKQSGQKTVLWKAPEQKPDLVWPMKITVSGGLHSNSPYRNSNILPQRIRGTAKLDTNSWLKKEL